MKKYKFADHFYINFIVLFFTVLLFILINYLNTGDEINLGTGLSTFLISILGLYLLSLPILLGIYVTYRYLSKTKILKILQLIFFPLIGALAIPLYFEFRGDEHWTTGLAVALFGLTNLILYLVNEIYLFANFKHLKKLK